MAEVAGNIENHAVLQFNDLTQLRAQQLTSKFQEAAIEKQAVGEFCYFDQVGLTEMREDNSRFPESPHQDVEHFRRKLGLRHFDWGHNIQRTDTVQMFTDREGQYVTAAGGAFARTVDTIFANALGGTAISENAAGTTQNISLPSTQKVAITVGGSSGNVNLNEQKIRTAISLLINNDVDPSDPMNRLYGMITPKSLFGGLAGQTAFTSIDFATRKALAEGMIMVFPYMGVTWIVSTKCPAGTTTPATDRFCYVWAKSGVGRATWSPLTTHMDLRADRCFVKYIYMEANLNVTRLEEKKVVEIEVDEEATATVG